MFNSLLCAVFVCWIFAALSPVSAAPPISPEAAIETTRFYGDMEEKRVFLSPDGERYAVAALTGDVARDGNWLTIMSGGLGSFKSAEPKVVARLFGRSLGDDENIFKSFLTVAGRLNWIDEDRVGFHWEDENGLIQYYAVNVVTEKTEQLTNHPTSLFQFGLNVGPDGALIYAALAGDRPRADEAFKKAVHEGFAADHEDLFALMEGVPSGEGLLDRLWGHKWFYQRRPDEAPVEITVAGRSKTLGMPLTATISPDGRFAVIGDFPGDIDPEWSKYTHPLFSLLIGKALEGSIKEFEVRSLKQLFVVDLSDRTVRPLWNALTQGFPPQVTWSPDGKRVLVSPTFLPPSDESDAGLAGEAVAVVEVATGNYLSIPLGDLEPRDLEDLRWVSDTRIAAATEDGAIAFQKSDDGWEAVSATGSPAAVTGNSASTLLIDVRGDLNTPPTLVAVDAETGRERTLYDPNPDLTSQFKFGRIEKVSWSAEDGRTWEGELYYPAGYKPGRRYPFVLQTHGGSESFSLYGYPDYSGLGTGSGVFVAQLLAGRDVGVLQVRDERGILQHEAAETYRRGFDGAVDYLIGKGLADPERIGIQGFSRTGWLIQYSLVNSDFVYAAAIAADNIEGGYVENSLLQEGNMEAENGAAPFGAEGLKHWLENAVPFNAERIYTPLLKVQQGPGALLRSGGTWELYARLRRLGRPVELYFMPDQEAHGGHQPQNPRQIAALQHRALDWWLFWLKGVEDPAPSKAKQYAEWRKLRGLQEATLEQPRPSKLEWTARSPAQ